MNVIKEVLHQIRIHHLIERGDFVIVGVSGGADSIGLLHILTRLQGDIGFTLLAVHMHHGLRGVEADEDARFVEQFCADYFVDLLRVDVNVAELAKQDGLGIEETGRKYRYQILEQIKDEYLSNTRNSLQITYKNIEESLKEKNKDFQFCLWENRNKSVFVIEPPGALSKKYPVKIALAHHKDDQAETILFHIIRGSGLKGCSGMPLQRGHIIRPLLFLSKEQILDYLKEEGIGFRTDSSNSSNVYTRNRIRNEILPMMQRNINPMATDNIVRAGSLFFEADAYFKKEADDILVRFARSDTDSIRIQVDVLNKKMSILRKYIIRGMLEALLERKGLKFRDIHHQHIVDVERLLQARTSSMVDLPHGMVAKREYVDIIVSLKKECAKTSLGSFESRVFAYDKRMQIPKDNDVRWFDLDKLGEIPVLRYRETGDYLYLQKVGRKTLKSYMIDRKIPKDMRDEIALLACGQHIVWLIGYRTSDAFLVDNHTTRILEIKYIKGREDELSH